MKRIRVVYLFALAFIAACGDGPSAPIDYAKIADSAATRAVPLVIAQLPPPRVDTVKIFDSTHVATSRTDTVVVQNTTSRVDTLEIHTTNTVTVSHVDTVRFEAMIPSELTLSHLWVKSISVGDQECQKGTQYRAVLCSDNEAIWGYISDLRGAYSQSNVSAMPKYAWSGLSGDGGFRTGQNQFDGRDNIDPVRGTIMYGPDTQGDFSWLIHHVGAPAARTQSLVLQQNDANGEIGFVSWMPGYRFTIRTSSCLFCGDLKWTAPTQ